MLKTFLKQFVLFLVLFAMFAVARRYFDLVFISFFIGGFVGMLLPDIDHLVYVYFLRPHELTSQRVSSMVSRNDYSGAFDILQRTGAERKHLVFHSVFFQLLFIAFAVFLITSTGSLFANGLAIGFLFHLVVDQLSDLLKYGNLENWFREPVNFKLDSNQTLIYWATMLLLVVFFGLFF